MKHENNKPAIEEIFKDGALIDLALKKAGKQALLKHKQSGNPVAIWQDGKVVWIPPEEIEIEIE
jgi:hypothetical protein